MISASTNDITYSGLAFAVALEIDHVASLEIFKVNYILWKFTSRVSSTLILANFWNYLISEKTLPIYSDVPAVIFEIIQQHSFLTVTLSWSKSKNNFGTIFISITYWVCYSLPVTMFPIILKQGINIDIYFIKL